MANTFISLTSLQIFFFSKRSLDYGVSLHDKLPFNNISLFIKLDQTDKMFSISNKKIKHKCQIQDKKEGKTEMPKRWKMWNIEKEYKNRGHSSNETFSNDTSSNDKTSLKNSIEIHILRTKEYNVPVE